MPIDASIPLQVRKAEIMGPGQALALENLAQQITQNSIKAQQAQKMQRDQVSLQQIFSLPGSTDPDTGLPTPESIRRVSSIDVMLGEKLGQQRMVSLQALSNLQAQKAQTDVRDMEKAKRMSDIFTELKGGAVGAYDIAKKSGNEQVAQQQYTQAWQSKFDELDASGAFAFLTPEERQKARTAPPINIARSQAMSLKDLSAQAATEEDRKLKHEETQQRLSQQQSEAQMRREDRQAVIEMKREDRAAADSGTVASSVSSLDRLEIAANKLLMHPGLKGITGLRGALPNIPGSAAADAEAQLNTLKSQIAFGVLQEMRNNSKTGGALGSVSDAEGKRLEANLAALEKAQSIEQMGQSLQAIMQYADEAKGRIRDTYNAKYPEKGGAPAPEPTAKKPIEQVGKLPAKIEGGTTPIYRSLVGLKKEDLKGGEVYQSTRGPALFTGRFSDKGDPIFKGIPNIKNEEDYNKLQSGDHFFDPDGKHRIKR